MTKEHYDFWRHYYLEWITFYRKPRVPGGVYVGLKYFTYAQAIKKTQADLADIRHKYYRGD